MLQQNTCSRIDEDSSAAIMLDIDLPLEARQVSVASTS